MLPYTVLRTKIIEINGKKIVGFEIDLPNAPPLIVLRGDKGFVMCGYMDIKVAEKLNLVAARITGVKNVEEALDKTISEATSKAMEQEIKPGMKVRDILKIL
ncbi:MAG: DUF1805 domain-containing protein [Staphylothermus sp.]|nr:DUF1805 domain-containing protein [Staphylothermus sp.]